MASNPASVGRNKLPGKKGSISRVSKPQGRKLPIGPSKGAKGQNMAVRSGSSGKATNVTAKTK